MKTRTLYFVVAITMLLSACGQTSQDLPTTAPPATPTEQAAATETPEQTNAELPAATSESEEVPEGTATLEPTVVLSYDGFHLENVGFATPESIRYDPEADIYLVANINGSPGSQDGNGFISKVSPAGEVIDLKWIDGTQDGVTLNAPKGMALTSAGLYVADIDAVRLFDRQTGASLDAFPVPGAVFLNDVTANEEGFIYVSDSSAGSIHSIAPDGAVMAVMPAGTIQNPNGLDVWSKKLYVTSGTGVFSVEKGILSQVFSVPQGGLDGLVFLDSENILVSSWSARAVYHVHAGGEAVEVASDVPSPADIGYDPLRNYILIPLFDGNAVIAHPLH